MGRKLIVIFMLLGGALLISAIAPGQAATSSQSSVTAEQALAVELFEAQLTGSEEVPAVVTEASGRALFVLDEDTSTLYYRIRVSNIAGITMAHIHTGAVGTVGPPVIPLWASGAADPFDSANAISGSVVLDADQITTLKAGNYYVNVHTTGYPDGEIRGQITTYSPSGFNTILTGREETPPVTTEATGWAHFVLNSTLDTITYHVYVSDIENITAAHLHPGFRGESGPPEIPLYTSTDPADFDPDNPLTGTVDLESPEQLLNLISGYYYLNVHTTANTAGEIRGQVMEGLHAFSAELRGRNEVPPVETTATGKAVVVLDADMMTLHYRVMVEDIQNITMAHIHIGMPGENGPPVLTLFPDEDETFGPGDPIHGSVTLTTEQVSNLIAGRYYVNVHTTANPNGEIRGQLERFSGTARFKAVLSDDEVEGVETGAEGIAQFWLNTLDGLDRLHYFIQVSGTVEITMAHIHTGFPGEVGPPVIPFFSPGDPRDFDPDNPISGDVSLDAEDLLNLLTGNFYVNVHTQAYPQGEIRGQVAPDWWVLLPTIFMGFDQAQP